MARIVGLIKFPEGLLLHISQTIGDARSGSEISELLRNAGYPNKSKLTGTKWRYLYELFKEFNVHPDTRNDILKIIQTFCDPTQWIGHRNEFLKILNNLNEGLVHINLQLNENGKIIFSKREKVPSLSIEKTELPKESRQMIVSPIFKERDVKQGENTCFVLMPFKPSFDRLYKDKIQPTVWSCGFKCSRADEIFSDKPILEDIWIHICKSKVIIADVTTKNPNVFYEIGIAHTIGKPVIILTQDKTDIPFDVAQYRYFLYSDDANGWNTLCSNIRSALKSFISRS
jgi:hypothetical protein